METYNDQISSTGPDYIDPMFQEPNLGDRFHAAGPDGDEWGDWDDYNDVPDHADDTDFWE